MKEDIQKLNKFGKGKHASAAIDDSDDEWSCGDVKLNPMSITLDEDKNTWCQVIDKE